MGLALGLIVTDQADEDPLWEWKLRIRRPSLAIRSGFADDRGLANDFGYYDGNETEGFDFMMSLITPV